MNRSVPTIMAVASAPGPSPRAILRISGPATIALIDQLFTEQLTHRELCPATLALDSQTTLPVLAMSMPAPKSFTSQHTLEIQLPGNAALLERLMHRLIELAQQIGRDVRFAEPGEFTRQAFEAGRIDLARAEGIAATIAATSDGQLAAATLLRRGALGQWATQMVDQLAGLLALVEAGIDFVDQDDVVAIEPAVLRDRLGGLIDRIDRQLHAPGQSIGEGALPWAVLVGRPNSGKSSLFNALLGRSRAVISDEAGTTRDVLCEPMLVEGREVMLVDIAGVEPGVGGLGQAMQSAGAGAIERADLLIELSDGPVPEASVRPGAPSIRVRSKADQGEAASDAFDVHVSAHSGAGLAALRRLIAQRLQSQQASVGGEVMLLGPRHVDCLHRARAELVGARAQEELELIASSMRTALDQLGEIGGQMSRDDVIGRVFATFCIGK